MQNGPDMSALNPTKSFYDRISPAYDLIANSHEHIARDRGIELLGVTPGENVIVVGCGTGHSLVALARLVGTTGRVLGVDISDGMLSVARKRIVEERVAERVEISLGDARDLAYGDSQWDAVFMAFTLELFDDHDIPRVLAQIRRVLRSGGRLGVVAMSKEPQETLMTEMYVWMHRHFPHWVDCRPISVATRLQQAEFVIERAETLSLWGLPVAVVVASKPRRRGDEFLRGSLSP
jgi:ubiquinone/menaquinone biosynthesis C-methylase UbiE